ncbi:hypothetical protein CANCADRAFT_82651 [Tortispora caseinolytica NRRL Y-17796]|uniref:Complex 1 LYR protein domain-containing protein n=1 Tax=Tortispora caseinolytica NRRL Y-17796 TaxID=767744 RepID=A0A1E4TK43_9ASCO|nr:hypothetical protein CANCADRAFT_82651 [Tortispora caseinolytica NRRL Y-17796]
MVRRSGLQRDVIELYRKCLRAVRTKPEDTRAHWRLFIREQFDAYAHVEKRDFSTIEYLLRKGNRMYDTYSAKGVRDIH